MLISWNGTASVSPAANAAGWYNSTVVITFDCTAGTASLASCSPPQTVSTEGTGQIVTGTATDAAGLSASTSVTLNVEKTPPIIAIGSPAEQSVLTSSSATVTGTVTNSLTSASGVTCNGVAASLSGGAFSCNISLVPGVNLVMVNATDVAGNMAGARLHLVYSAALPPANALQVTPAQVTMLVGETQQFTAVDEQGRPRPDATWTVSDTNIAAITTDSAPTLTGLAAGQVTLTATVGSVSADAQVTIVAGTSLPVGTVRWSAPPISGFTTQRIIQAAPSSANTPDLYSLDTDSGGNYLVRAFTGDGQQLWQTTIPVSTLSGLDASSGQAMGDTSGGLLLFGSSGASTVLDIDGQTGSIAWQSSSATWGYSSSAALGPDGSVFVQDLQDQNGAMLKINPETGLASTLYVGPVNSGPSSLTANCNSGVPTLIVLGYGSWPASLSSPIVDAQGNVLFTASTGTTSYTPICVDNGVDASIEETNTYHDLFVKVAPDGTATTTSLPISDPVESLHVVAPDGNAGALLTWWTQPSQPVSYMMSTSSGNVYPTPLNAVNPQLILGENGNAFVTDGTSVAAFDSSSGTTQWTYQPAPGVNSIFATHGGGLTILDGQLNQIPVDSSGNPTSAITIPGVGSLLQPSWTGKWNGISATGLASFATPVFPWAHSLWAALAGSPSPNRSSAEMPWFPPLPTCQSLSTPCAGEATWNAFKSLQSLIAGTCSSCDTYVFSKLGRSRKQFSDFLNVPALISDGASSHAPMSIMCAWYDLLCPFYGVSETVSHFMTRKEASAISRTSHAKGPVIFVNPVSVCTAGTAPGAALNEAMLFHEALHGLTGLYDDDLANALLGPNSENYNSQGSVAITYYLEVNVLGFNLTYHDPGQGNGPLTCPN